MMRTLTLAAAVLLTMTAMPSASAFYMQSPQIAELEMSDDPPVPCSQEGDSTLERTLDQTYGATCFAIAIVENTVNPVVVEVNERVDEVVSIVNDAVTDVENRADATIAFVSGQGQGICDEQLGGFCPLPVSA